MRFTHQEGCTITDAWTYKGMRVVWLENEILRVGILPDRGGDIFEFRYKPAGINLLLNLPGRLRNLSTDFSQMRDTQNQFEDHYYGGWQEIFPNSKPFNYRGASLGQHGEVSLIPWQYDIVDRGASRVSVRLTSGPVRMPLTVEKVISLDEGSGRMVIAETLTNHGSTPIDLMWGHHIALGLPFVENELKIETNASTILSEALMPAKRRFKPGAVTDWPYVEGVDGEQVDASVFPGREDGVYSELSYLEGYPKDGFYRVRNRQSGLVFNVEWDAEVFKCLWMWQERNAVQDFPWWGNCYTLALEPWTSRWTDEPEGAIERQEWLRIQPGSSVSATLAAGITKDKNHD